MPQKPNEGFGIEEAIQVLSAAESDQRRSLPALHGGDLIAHTASPVPA